MATYEITSKSGATYQIEAESPSDALTKVNLYEMQIERQGGAAPAEKGIGMFGQAVAGEQRGLSDVLGAPVDIAAAGLRMAGLPIGQEPVGGSESIQSLLNLPRTMRGEQRLTDIPPVGPSERVAEATGYGLGQATTLGSGLLAKGTQRAAAPAMTAPPKGGPVSRAINELADVAATDPARFAAAEAGAGAAGGAASGVTQEVLPEGGPTAQMLASIPAAIVGGRVAQRAATPSGAKLTPDRVRAQAETMYADIEASGVTVPGQYLQNAATKMRKLLNDRGAINPDTGEIKSRMANVKDALATVEGYATAQNLTPTQIMAIRRGLMDDIQASESTDRYLLVQMLKEFDQATGSLSPQIRAANSVYNTAMKGQAIQKMVRLAEANSSKMTQGGMNNALRQQFEQLNRRIIKGQETGWTAAEQKEIAEIIKGKGMHRMLNFVGRFAPTGPVGLISTLGVGASAGGFAGPEASIPAALAVAGTTTAARSGAGMLRQRSVDQFVQNILGGRTGLSQQGQERLDAAVKAYMLGQGATAFPE